METQESCLSVVMFPWLAHGHIFAFLELSRALLTRKKLKIYFCSTAINLDSINNYINKHSLNDSIYPVELELEPSPDLPPHYHTTKNLPKSLIFTPFQTSHPSFSNIIATTKPGLLLYDRFQPWAAKIAASRGIPAVHFSTCGAAPLALFHHRYTFKDAAFPFPELNFKEHELKTQTTAVQFLNLHIRDVDPQHFYFGNFKHSCDMVLVKTIRGMEGKYIDYLSSMSERKIVPVGPLITHTAVNSGDDKNSAVMKWLSKKGKNSTLFISFGSEYFLSEDEIAEIAKGLELCSSSKVNFIWIIRSPLGATVSAEDALPGGFIERMRESGRGLVVTGWVPQASILAHENTGGFMSHCGWSSVMESTYFGVPIVALGMKVDQPINARMLAEAGSCVEVRRKDGDVEFEGEEIAKAIEKVMAEESGGGLRRRAREMSERLKMEEGHLMDEAAHQLWQLCLNKT